MYLLKQYCNAIFETCLRYFRILGQMIVFTDNMIL